MGRSGHGKTSPGVGDWVWTLFLLGLLVFTAWLAFSVAGLQLLGSRARVYSLASLVLLGILLPFRVAALVKGRRTAYVRWDFCIFLVPLVFLPFAGSLNGGASIAGAKVRFIPPTKSLVVVAPRSVIPLAPVSAVQAYVAPAVREEDGEPKAVEASQESFLVLDKDNFEALSDEVGGAADKYRGRRVALEGFILPSESGQAGRFSVGRLMITCCPADGIFVGLDARLDGEGELPAKDSWWHLEGEVEPVRSEGVTTAVLKVIKMEPRPLPEDPYIYQH